MIKKITSLLLMFMVFGCAKNNTTPNYSSSILGKWEAVNEVHWITPSSGSIIKDTIVDDSTYWDFKSGSGHNLVITTKNNPIPTDTTWSYGIVGNELIYGNSSSGGLGQAIQSINTKNMVWYMSSSSGSCKYEFWWNFIR